MLGNMVLHFHGQLLVTILNTCLCKRKVVICLYCFLCFFIILRLFQKYESVLFYTFLPVEDLVDSLEGDQIDTKLGHGDSLTILLANAVKYYGVSPLFKVIRFENDKFAVSTV
jgi:hypothetical protein